MKQETRLARLEQRARAVAGVPLVVLYRLEDGTERKGTVEDMIRAGGLFVSVLSGNSLTDVDKILDDFLEQVRRDP